jgi:hypothetical protein
MVLTICKEKSEWLEMIQDPTTQDFLSQKQGLEDVCSPVMQKLSEPRKCFITISQWNALPTDTILAPSLSAFRSRVMRAATH